MPEVDPTSGVGGSGATDGLEVGRVCSVRHPTSSPVSSHTDGSDTKRP